LTSEQLEAARAERMRQNGHGTITLEDARTWIEETGLCLFLPRRQFSSSIAPSFVEAVAGQRDATPNPPQIAAAEELLVRLELDGVAVRLNLLGQPGEQPDFVVAGWVLPYVYALRGDRDWRRTPQLTGSRQVSPLAVQAYKLLEANETNITDLTHKLGREVTEAAVLRAITELWQQLRIIPVIDAPGKAARWQLLRLRFQKAIAEGASTSQVTAISVLASIYLQAVIAATMEEVEIFLSPLTARSKVREVLRGLVATRQVHTISMGHAPHFYVAGTLPEFSIAATLYANSSLPASAYYLRHQDEEEEDAVIENPPSPQPSAAKEKDSESPLPLSAAEKTALEGVSEAEPVARERAANSAQPAQQAKMEASAPRAKTEHKPRSVGKQEETRPRFSRPAADSRDRKPAHGSSSSRPARRPGSDSRPSGSSNGSRPASGSRPAGGTRWSANAPSAAGQRKDSSSARPANGLRPKPHAAGAGNESKAGKPASAWSPSKNHGSSARPAGKPASSAHGSAAPRKDARPAPAGGSRKPAASGSRPASANRFGAHSRPASRSAARPSQGPKKRG
jgi:hypothetical protein